MSTQLPPVGNNTQLLAQIIEVLQAASPLNQIEPSLSQETSSNRLLSLLAQAVQNHPALTLANQLTPDNSTITASQGVISAVGGGSGSGTVNTGTTNQLAYYAANGTAVSGTGALPNGTTATTQSPGDNTTKVSTTAYANAAATAAVSGLAPLASPALTGTPTAPTAAAATNTTQLATTAMVQAALAGSNAPIRTIHLQTFASSGTYTPTTGMVYCIVEVQAAGGGAVATGSTTDSGGGGGGGYGKSILTASNVGASKAVTIGAVSAGGTPGNTSFGALIVANGGSVSAAASTTFSVGGAGGTCTGGNVDNITGQQGGYSYQPGSLVGSGGNAVLGFGGVSTVSGQSAAATGYGGGAGGNNGSGGTAASGAPAIVIVTEFCSQ